MKRHVMLAGLIGLAVAGAAVLWLSNRPGLRVVAVKGENGEPARSVVVLGADGAARDFIRVVEPRDGARVSLARTDDVVFRWRAVPGATRYMFVANDEVGNIVWRAATADTTFRLPEKAWKILVPGERLKWIVQVPGMPWSSDINRIRVGS